MRKRTDGSRDKRSGARPLKRTGRSLLAGTVLLSALSVPATAQAVPGDLVVSDGWAFGSPGTPRGGVIEVGAADGKRTSVSENAAPPGTPEFGGNGVTWLATQADQQVVVSGHFNLVLGSNTDHEGLIEVDYPGGTRDGVSLAGGTTGELPFDDPDFSWPFGVAVEPTGDFIVADYILPGVIRVDAATGRRSILSDNGSPKGPGVRDYRFLTDVAVLPNGDIAVAGLGGTTTQTACVTPPTQCGIVWRVDPTTGARSELASNKTIPQVPVAARLDAPWGIAVEPSGDLLVANQGPHALGIIRIDESTGDKTVVSNNTFGGNTAYETPQDLVTDGNAIYVTDLGALGSQGDEHVIKVEQNGIKNNLSSNTSPSGGPSFANPVGIDFVPVPLRSATASPTVFAPGTIGGRGTRFKYRLGEPAEVTFALWRRDRGRVVGGRCRKETRRNLRGRACVRWRRVGSFTHRGRRGGNSVRFSGLLRSQRGSRALEAGRHRAVLAARNANGVRSVPVAVDFRIDPVRAPR